jgi:hypothetical protein
MSGCVSEGAARVEKITGKKVPFHVVDLLDTETLRSVFKQVIQIIWASNVISM